RPVTRVVLGYKRAGAFYHLLMMTHALPVVKARTVAFRPRKDALVAFRSRERATLAARPALARAMPHAVSLAFGTNGARRPPWQRSGSSRRTAINTDRFPRSSSGSLCRSEW